MKQKQFSPSSGIESLAVVPISRVRAPPFFVYVCVCLIPAAVFAERRDAARRASGAHGPREVFQAVHEGHLYHIRGEHNAGDNAIQLV